MYSYDPDQQNAKPFWQRVFGFRRLLGSLPPPSVTSQQMGKGRFWASQSVSPSPDAPPRHGTAGTAGRPTLKRQNAFKLSEAESQALTQQLGISTHGHSGSGHDLLSEASQEAAGEAESAPAEQFNSKATVGLEGVLSSVGGSLKGALLGEATGGPYIPSSPGPDLHQPFNASAAYANITRCNTKRWVALYTSGAFTRQTELRPDQSGITSCSAVVSVSTLMRLLRLVALFTAAHFSCNSCMIAKRRAFVNSVKSLRTDYSGPTGLTMYMPSLS